MRSENQISEIKIQSHYLRSNWLVGFGWDQNLWSEKKMPHRKTLDQHFPDRPVFFSRIDGHSSWVNSLALKEFEKMGYDFSSEITGGIIYRDSNGPTGVLSDQAHIKALLMLPAFTEQQTEAFCLASMSYFNRAGMTHIRDLSMNSSIWKVLCKLQAEKRQTLCIDSFFTAESVSDLNRAYKDYLECLDLPNPYLRAHGLKIFIDGSLGSKTAYLSENYKGQSSSGLISWSQQDIATAIEFCWKHKIAIAIHTIGDQAVHTAALAARAVSAAGFEGKLHLEHVQILRPETLGLLKPLHVTVHMQPCHWLSDYSWIDQTLPESLLPYLFQWQKIIKNKIPLFFGSDSPIEPSSLFKTKQALDLRTKFKIPKLETDWKTHHSHTDKDWASSVTRFDENQILEVIFDSRQII